MIVVIKLFSCGINFFTNVISLSTVSIFVKNMKHPSKFNTMNLLQNFYTSIKLSNYSLVYLSCWLRKKSELPLLNKKVRVLNSCVKYIYMDLTMWIKRSWI